MFKIHAFFAPVTIALFIMALFTINSEASFAEDAPKYAAGEYAYNVMRNGTQIGTYVFDVQHQDDMVVMDVKMDIEVKLLFASVYNAHFKGKKFYKNGELVKARGEGDFNGKVSEFKYDSSTSTLVRNGDKSHIEHEVVMLKPFMPHDIKGTYVGLSEKGKHYKSHFDDHGMVKKKSGIKFKKFHKLSFTSDIKRDLFYTPEGILHSLSYEKDGDDITFERQHESKY